MNRPSTSASPAAAASNQRLSLSATMEDEHIVRAPRSRPSTSARPSATAALYRGLFRNLIRQPPTTQTAARRNPPNLATGDRDRERVLETLKLFRERREEIIQNGKSEAELWRPDLQAYTEMKRRLRIPSTGYLGAAPGVQVGDRFEFRVELILTGVHAHMQRGIDLATIGGIRGNSLATCVISKIGYRDGMEHPDFIVYRGEGGMIRDKEKKRSIFSDQVMRNGNQALKNSLEEKTDVRVLRGVQDPSRRSGNVIYVYDGLYKVVGFQKKESEFGNKVFDFHLRRNPGQMSIDWSKYKRG